MRLHIGGRVGLASRRVFDGHPGVAISNGRRLIHRTALRALLLTGAVLGPAATAFPALAAESSIRAVVEVPAGSLEHALNAFARQAGITLSFDPSLVRDRSAGPLSGPHTVAEGLARLLAAHRLEARRESDGAYVVRPSAAAEPVADAGPGLAPITVTGAPERADGPVAGYVAQRSSIVARADDALIGLPHSVTVVTRAQMDDQAVQTVGQSLRYSAGVLTDATGHDLPLASLTVRGVAASEYLDGFRLFSLSPYTGWVAEPQGLERIELQRGAAGVLYDQAAPGAVINMVSKRPTADAVREVAVSTGNHDRYQSSFDIGGGLDADRNLSFRLNGLVRKSGGQTDFSRDDRAYIAPALTWQPGARTSITLLADAMRDRMTPKSAWPQAALLMPNPNGRIPFSRFVGEPDVSRYHRKTSSITYLLSHRIDENRSFRQSARYAALDLEYVQVAGTSFRGDARTLDREAIFWRNDIRNLSIDNQFEWRFKAGSFAHTVLAGMDYRVYSGDGSLGEGPAPAIDAFTPVYQASAALNRRIAAAVLPTQSIRLRQLGMYLQDQVRSGPWSLSLAVRRDMLRAESSFDFLGEIDFTKPPRIAPRSDPQDRKTTYSLGLSYLAANGLAPYLSYSTSFVPVPGSGLDGTPFKPELGRQFEAGLKYRPPGMDMLLTLSAFDLSQNNLSISDTNRPSVQMQIDKVRARGLEFEARGALNARLQLIGSFSLLDARIVGAKNPAELGKRLPRAARNAAALWLDYRLGGGELQGWSVSAGVRHVGTVPADPANGLFNPSHTLVDAAVRYERGPHGVALNATNLFDRRYVSGFGQFYGQGRAMQLKWTYRW